MPRTFEGSRRWLTFLIDLRRVSPEVWMRLGEVSSNCEHIAGVPLRPETAAQLYSLFLAKGALATTAIEGNTLTEGEVLQLLDGKLELPKSRQYLAKEVENIVEACNEIASKCHSVSGDISVERIKAFNRQALEGLPLEPHIVPGKIREFDVTVGRYRGAPHQDCAYLLERMCSWLNEPAFRLDGEQSVPYAVLRAVLAHLYLAWIHPFGDGNGRTARLVEFFFLLCAGVPYPAAHLLSNHYNQTRTEYYRQLEAASSSGGDVMPFLSYAVQGLVDGLREQLKQIRAQQWDITWRDFVGDAFAGETTQAAIRQRDLVLDLGTDWISTAELPSLSPRLARAYATKQSKTVTRDVNALVQRGLIDRKGQKVRARREMILAFLPPRRVRSQESSKAD